MKTQPIDNIEWIDVADLDANDYNPNMVMDTELKLLELSILRSGWIQPIIIDNARRIIDGYHRYRLSADSKHMKKEFGGRVPCATIDADRGQAICLTIRMNRAKGTHAAVRMADCVQELIDKHSYQEADLISELGMTRQEIELLYEDSIFNSKRIKKYKYSEAWIPKESKIDPKPEPAQSSD